MQERSKGAKTRRYTIAFRLVEEPCRSSRRHNGPQRIVRGERWFLHNFCYFGRVYDQQADSQRGTAGCEEWTVESGMGRIVWWETRLRGVSSGSISGLPGATVPFLLVYLRLIKHRSFLVPVRPSVSACSLDQFKRRKELTCWSSRDNRRDEWIDSYTCFHQFSMNAFARLKNVDIFLSLIFIRILATIQSDVAIIHFWFSENGEDKIAGTLKARKNLHLNDFSLAPINLSVCANLWTHCFLGNVVANLSLDHLETARVRWRYITSSGVLP